MSEQFEPFYDVNRTYEDNYEQGPFGLFAEALKGSRARRPSPAHPPRPPNRPSPPTRSSACR